jgi:starch phosphorylase
LQWQQNIAQEWNTVRFGTMQVETRDGRHFFRIQVLPGILPVGDLKVELYASPLEKGDAVVETMKACDQCKAPNGAVTYSGQVTAVRGPWDYTPRIMPYHPAASLPLEAGQILWQR